MPELQFCLLTKYSLLYFFSVMWVFVLFWIWIVFKKKVLKKLLVTWFWSVTGVAVVTVGYLDIAVLSTTYHFLVGHSTTIIMYVHLFVYICTYVYSFCVWFTYFVYSTLPFYNKVLKNVLESTLIPKMHFNLCVLEIIN